MERAQSAYNNLNQLKVKVLNLMSLPKGETPETISKYQFIHTHLDGALDVIDARIGHKTN